jgi:general stress protein 26
MSTTPDPAKPLSDLVDGGTIAMLMTMIGDEHTSRPLSVAEVSGHRLGFLVDATTEWAMAIRDGSAIVHATVCDVRKNHYLSLNGTASLTLDHDEIERLWNPAAAAYFDGPDDPGIAVLRFEVDGGEYWDAPSGRIGSAIAAIKAAVTGNPDASGEQGPIAAR